MPEPIKYWLRKQRNIYRKSIKQFERIQNTIKVTGKTKYFCIGFNKTGTTSIKKAFEDLGFIVGDQSVAEVLTDRYYFNSEFGPIIRYCQTAEVFQDVPFSYPETFKYLDKAYPNSKFILTVRDTPEQWYNSLVNFHAKRYGLNGPVPTYEDLQQEKYQGAGLTINLMSVHNTSKEDPYNKDILIKNYKNHVHAVKDYFKNRPHDLLVLNVAEPNGY